MNQKEIKDVVLDQNQLRENEELIDREAFVELEEHLKNSFVIVISGVRRCGKSTLLNQLREKHPGYYLNFDDDRLINFKVEDFQTLYEIFIELYGEKNIFYFDEIQNIKSWERFVRRLHDERKKVFVSGSNASMLSKELGTHLTGRHLNLQLFPFSFKEFLSFKGLELDKKSSYITEMKAKIKRYFGEYYTNGGFPDYLKTSDKEYLKTLYNNILYRDVIVRYNLSSERTMKEFVNFVTSNIAKAISFNSIKNILGLGSSTTVKDYFGYLENCFLLFIVPRFEYSLKKQMYANKKVYIIDNGLALYLGYRFSEDTGRLLENLVFIELKRSGKEIYFYSDKHECDFVIKDRAKIVEAVQVCYDLNEDNKKREIDGIVEAMVKFKLKEGLILTYDQEDELKIEGRKVKVIPVWKWLINSS